MKGSKFSVWAIDAWTDDEFGWDWNDKSKLFEFSTKAIDVKRVFVRKLRKFLSDGVMTISGLREHIDLGRGWYRVEGDLDILELKCRRNGKPVYACIREPE